MITFKQFLDEEFRFDNLKAEGIYKNPTSKEWKDILPRVRGIVTITGDFYVATGEKGVKSLHIHLARRANEFYKDNNVKEFKVGASVLIKKIVTVERLGNSNVFALGETEGNEGGRGPLKRNSFKEGEVKFIKKVLKLARVKNPKIKFTLRNIEEEE